jgi:hypothetical protein
MAGGLEMTGHPRGANPSGAIARAGLLAALLILTSAAVARGQIFSRPADVDLRVEWTEEEDRRGRPIVSGYVYNLRAGSFATGVRLLVEALDASGQVVGSTAGSVLGDVLPSSRSYFEIKAPAKAASYRVTIQSSAWRAYGAGGG